VLIIDGVTNFSIMAGNGTGGEESGGRIIHGKLEVIGNILMHTCKIVDIIMILQTI